MKADPKFLAPGADGELEPEANLWRKGLVYTSRIERDSRTDSLAIPTASQPASKRELNPRVRQLAFMTFTGG